MLGTNEIIFAEFLLTIAVAFILLMALFVNRKFIYISILITIFIYQVIISSRTVEYNSDTANYFQYFNGIGLYSVIEAMVIKIEPFHYYLMVLSPTFSKWLLLESLIYFLLLVLLLKNKSLVTSGLIMGATLPLMSSSLRFSIGLMICSLIYSALIKTKYASFLSGVIGGGAHISMLAAPLVVKSTKIQILFIITFTIFLNISPWFIARLSSDGEIGTISGFVGLKTLAASVIFYLHAKLNYRNVITKEGSFELFSHIASTFILCIFASFVFQMANRWMILSLLLFAIKFDSDKRFKLKKGYYDPIFGSLLFSLMALPQALVVFINGGWIE